MLFCLHIVVSNTSWLWVTWCSFYKRQELLSLCEHVGLHLVFGWDRVFSFLCLLFVLFVFVWRICVPNVASVSGLSIRNFPFRCFLTSIFPVSFLLVQTYRPSGTDIFWNKILQSNMITFSRFLDFTIENRKCKSKQWVNNTYFSPVNVQSDSRHHWKSLR